MIAIIRIAGHVDMRQDLEETLHRLRLRKKYTMILAKPSKELSANLQRIRNFVAFGDIDNETLKLLLEKRAKSLDSKKKINAAEIISSLDKKSLEDLGIKPFFSLHPPRGGIDSKLHFGITNKAVLGDNKTKINELIRRML